MESINYIVTAKHYSRAEGADGTVRDRILKMRDHIRQRQGITIQINNIDGPSGIPAMARIWQGQWIADCPSCNGAQFVDPDEPIYFCFVCVNRDNNQTPRPVIFPPEAERLEIERLLLERPVNDMAGLTDLERAGMARPLLSAEISMPDGTIGVVALARNWNPGETVFDLVLQNAPVYAWRKNKEGA